jgi:hypothetical protein
MPGWIIPPPKESTKRREALAAERLAKELETLMARGLDEETAVDVIVRGMLGR